MKWQLERAKDGAPIGTFEQLGQRWTYSNDVTKQIVAPTVRLAARRGLTAAQSAAFWSGWSNGYLRTRAL